MSDHAPLSPSAADRWIACPASLRLGAKYDRGDGDGGSAYAREGTTAHELAALKVEAAFGQATADDVAKWVAEHQHLGEDVLDEMNRHTDAYVDFVRRQAASMKHPRLNTEVRVDTGVPESWGTADCVLFSPWELKVTDFKYGSGVAVEAAGNPQLKLYALGVLKAYQGLLGQYDEITISIAQPRLGIWKSVLVSVLELERWRDDVVKPAAVLALSDNAPFGPSLETCRWCPAHGRCDAQARSVWETDFGDDPDTLSPAQIADALEAAPAIKAWLSQLEAAALSMAYSEGTPIPGWKVVRSGGKRSIPEAAHAIQRFVDAGYPADKVAKVAVLGIGQLEKVVGGRARLEAILGDLIVKSRGSEALVPEDDSREAVNPETEAAKVFTKEEGE